MLVFSGVMQNKTFNHIGAIFCNHRSSPRFIFRSKGLKPGNLFKGGASSNLRGAVESKGGRVWHIHPFALLGTDLFV